MRNGQSIGINIGVTAIILNISMILLSVSAYATKAASISINRMPHIEGYGYNIGLYIAGGGEVGYVFDKRECYAESYGSGCFVFLVSTKEVVPNIEGCSRVGSSEIKCSAAAVTGLFIAIRDGGVLSKRNLNNNKIYNICSPVPVYITLSGKINHQIDVKNGCIESVACSSNFNGVIMSDKFDYISPNCHVGQYAD